MRTGCGLAKVCEWPPLLTARHALQQAAWDLPDTRNRAPMALIKRCLGSLIDRARDLLIMPEVSQPADPLSILRGHAVHVEMQSAADLAEASG